MHNYLKHNFAYNSLILRHVSTFFRSFSGSFTSNSIHNTQIHLCLIYYWMIRETVFLRLMHLLVLTTKLFIKGRIWTVLMLCTVSHSSQTSQHKIPLLRLTAYRHQNETYTKLRMDKCLLLIRHKFYLNVF